MVKKHFWLFIVAVVVGRMCWVLKWVKMWRQLYNVSTRIESGVVSGCTYMGKKIGH
jgi:hypothetical protein